jgi:RNA polymerase sigma factor (sigma-70 family)
MSQVQSKNGRRKASKKATDNTDNTDNKSDSTAAVQDAPRAQDHVPLARQIAMRLSRWYPWVPFEDLSSYAYLGLAMAAKAYQPGRGVPFPNFAAQKGLFLTIDEMRKDGVLKRRRSKPTKVETPLTMDVPDPRGGSDHASLERRDLCVTLLKRLRGQDRQLLMMYYGEQMTFKEIAHTFEVSESAVCLRHKALIRKLQKMASSRRIA